MDRFLNVVRTEQEVGAEFAGSDRGIMTGGSSEVLKGVPMSAEMTGRVDMGAAVAPEMNIDVFHNMPLPQINM